MSAERIVLLPAERVVLPGVVVQAALVLRLSGIAATASGVTAAAGIAASRVAAALPLPGQRYSRSESQGHHWNQFGNAHGTASSVSLQQALAA